MQPCLHSTALHHLTDSNLLLDLQESASNYPLQADPLFRRRFAYNMSYELAATVPVTYADRPYLSGPHDLSSVSSGIGQGA